MRLLFEVKMREMLYNNHIILLGRQKSQKILSEGLKLTKYVFNQSLYNLIGSILTSISKQCSI